MNYELLYSDLVVAEDIPKLSKEAKEWIRLSIEKKLKTHPESYGHPLRRNLKGCWKLRVGHYRVLFRVQGKKVFIEMIGHRSIVYKNVLKRLGIKG